MEDDNQDSDIVAQILNEVLAVVAPSNMAVSCSVYTVPCYDDEGDEDELVACIHGALAHKVRESEVDFMRASCSLRKST
jgi:hypothetical protein